MTKPNRGMSNLLLIILDHLKALGTLPAPAGQIHPTFPDITAHKDTTKSYKYKYTVKFR